MEASLGLPTAMSTREVPVKVFEENRRIINSYLTDMAHARCSFTHLIAFAMIKAAVQVPAMNLGYRKPTKAPPNSSGRGSTWAWPLICRDVVAPFIGGSQHKVL